MKKLFGNKREEVIDVGKSCFDVDDREKYKILEPLWALLENIPGDQKVKTEDIWRLSNIDPAVGNPLLAEFSAEFQRHMLKHIMKLAFNPNQIIDSWTFDKIMLMATRVNTGSGIEVETGIPDGLGGVWDSWKSKWMAKRGI